MDGNKIANTSKIGECVQRAKMIHTMIAPAAIQARTAAQCSSRWFRSVSCSTLSHAAYSLSLTALRSTAEYVCSSVSSACAARQSAILGNALEGSWPSSSTADWNSWEIQVSDAKAAFRNHRCLRAIQTTNTPTANNIASTPSKIWDCIMEWVNAAEYAASATTVITGGRKALTKAVRRTSLFQSVALNCFAPPRSI